MEEKKVLRQEQINSHNSDGNKGNKKLVLIALFLITALIFTAIGAGGYALLTRENDSETSQADDNNVAVKDNEESSTKTKECVYDDNVYKMIFDIPEEWECTEGTTESGAYSLYMTKSTDFKIRVGPFFETACSSPDTDCETNTLYDNSKISLDRVISNNPDGSSSTFIRGYLKDITLGEVGLTVVTPDLSKRELSVEEEKEIFPILESIEVTDLRSNWQTYTSNDSDLSFRYPSEFELIDLRDSPSEEGVEVTFTDDNENIIYWIQFFTTPPVDSVELLKDGSVGNAKKGDEVFMTVGNEVYAAQEYYSAEGAPSYDNPDYVDSDTWTGYLIEVNDDLTIFVNSKSYNYWDADKNAAIEGEITNEIQGFGEAILTTVELE